MILNDERLKNIKVKLSLQSYLLKHTIPNKSFYIVNFLLIYFYYYNKKVP